MRRARVRFASAGRGTAGTLTATGPLGLEGGTAAGLTDTARRAAGLTGFILFAGFLAVAFLATTLVAFFAARTGAAERLTTRFLVARAADLARVATLPVTRRAALTAFFPCTLAIDELSPRPA